jgi:ankyrin repeat protein
VEAVKNGHFEVARLLLDKGAYVDTTWGNTSPPLVLAAEAGHVEIVRLLLEHGADVSLRGSGGWSALELAEENGHTKIVAMLKDAGKGMMQWIFGHGMSCALFSEFRGHGTEEPMSPEFSRDPLGGWENTRLPRRLHSSQ